MFKRLEQAWSTWLRWVALGVGLVLALLGTVWPVLMWAGWAVIITAGVINLSYGVAIARLLVQRRRRRKVGAR